MARADEPFLGRWSRLKGERRRREADPADVPPNDDAEAPAAQSDAGEDAAAPLDLPDIESLDKDSDYTVFMREGVPEELKKLALRKLWLSDPDLAVLDGLNDYDEDFRVTDKILSEVAKGGDEAGEEAADAGAGGKANEEKEDEVAAAKGAEEPQMPASEARQEDEPATGAEEGDITGDAAKEGGGNSG